MNLEDYRLLKSCALVNETRLDGSTVKPIAREGDLSNRVSPASAAVYFARAVFDEHLPYMREFDSYGILTIFINDHFLREARRQFSGTIIESDTMFSHEEQQFFDDYALWVMGDVYIGELLQGLEALDFWLVEEIQNHLHPTINRSYDETHKWRKTTERVE